MKRKIVFAVVGGLFIALAVVAFILRAVLQIESGNGPGYRNYSPQWMNYLGALATLGIAALVGLVGLYYRAKRFLQKRTAKKTL